MPLEVNKNNQQVDIILWLKCNEKCSFCFQNTDYIKKYDIPFQEYDFLKPLVLGKKLWLTRVNISWWEPTLYLPQLLFVLKAAVRLWYSEIKLITNGIRFSSFDFSSQVLPYITDIWFSFHSSDKHTQDSLTWLVWSYELVLQAIKNIRTFFPQINLHNHCVITKANIWDLEGHTRHIISLGFSSLHFLSLMHNTSENKWQTYDFSELTQTLTHIINTYKEKISLEISYVQPCFFPWYEPYVLGFEYGKKYISNNPQALTSWEDTMLQNMEYKEVCATCSYKGKCYWFWKV